MNEQVIDNIRKINSTSKRCKILGKYNNLLDKIEIILGGNVMNKLDSDNKISLNLELTFNKIEKALDEFIENNIQP